MATFIIIAIWLLLNLIVWPVMIGITAGHAGNWIAAIFVFSWPFLIGSLPMIMAIGVAKDIFKEIK